MSGPPVKKPMRQKAKRSSVRVAGSKKAPANSAAFLAVPEKPMDRTPPMSPRGEEAGELGAAMLCDVGGAANCLSDDPPWTPSLLQPTLTVTPGDGFAEDCGEGAGAILDRDVDGVDEDSDVVPELARRAGSPGSSVSETTLWDHVGLQAGLSVSSATVPFAKAEKK